jgi:hypothetical protein
VESAPTSNDSVEIKGFDGDAIPADDDGPGAGGGYKPQQDPVEGPGAGGGYDGDEIPADDDGPGAGGGYDGVEQEPAESDGPGAGGGYLTAPSSTYEIAGAWNQPLALFSASTSPEVSVYSSTGDYAPHWVQVLPQAAYSWTDSTGVTPLLVDVKSPADVASDPLKKVDGE